MKFSIPKPGNYFFILPWIAFIPWWGMLITMLICWAAQGHPIYWFMHSEQFPVYISDIGATNLRPLFISCAGWQGLGYFLTICSEYYQRGGFGMVSSNRSINKKHYMPPWFTRDERNLIIAAAVLGGLGEICLLMCSIFSTALYHHVHLSMVGLFVVFMFCSVCCLSGCYFVMGKQYALLHPLNKGNADGVKHTHIDQLRWNQWEGKVWNKYTTSATAKMVWLTLALIWAICFGGISNNSRSSCFEWLLAFWFGVLFMIISVDFYIGGRYRQSKYFNQIYNFGGFYKYDEMAAHNGVVYDKCIETSENGDPMSHKEDTDEISSSSSSPVSLKVES